MKKIVLLLVISVLNGCKAKTTTKISEPKKATMIKLSTEDINSIQKSRSYELGKRVLMTCNTSTFKPFTSDEATDEVIQNINKDKISLTCQNILRKFGQFQDIKLKEVFRLEKEDLTIFRYQCIYEKKYSIKELRVSVNDENKITSITTKDWKDAYQP
jgi:hypothetical protein